ncbi:hypothetical protein KFE94_14265 [bacterium SCSIO 12643]|nr:hypothetical protein KFE94_14265 [bacterium SCSIO 12643]
MIRLLRFAIILFPLFISCEGKRERIPAYITIEKIDFNYDNVSVLGNGGTAITDAWVFDNDNLLGVFELPATVAVAAEGSHKLTVAAGIKLNGISSTRERYAFYEQWNDDVTLTPLDTVVAEPKVRYFTDTGISFKEEFENAVSKIDTAPSSDVALVKTLVTNGPTYLGKFVGKATMTEDKPGFKAYNTDLFMVPVSSTLPMYLELDYKCNQNLIISTLIQEPGNGTVENPLITLRSTEENGELKWKHIYIDLTDRFAGLVNATGFGIGFTAYYNDGNPEGLVYIDNAKVVNTK